ncbi:MAG TPA: hypothetical protein VIX58_02655 [Anaerolineae bacterium]
MVTTNSQDSAKQLNESRRQGDTHMPIPVRRYWIYLLGAGTFIVLMGAWVMVANPASAWWWLCGLPVLFLGTLVVWLAENARSGHWVYVNVNAKGQKATHHVRVVSPLPIGLARGGLSVARRFTPRLDRTLNEKGVDVDAILVALDQGLTDDQGISIEVDEDDSEVQVYIV